MSASITLTKECIDSLIARSIITDTKMGEKTTVVCCKLPNGFEIIESSSCIDPANYNHALGIKTCMGRIIDQAWKMEGYWLQSFLHTTKLPVAHVQQQGV